jgi:hypothetical protein
MLSELAAGQPIPLEKRAYFHARVLNNFYQFILQKFLEEERAGRLSKAELARRIDKRPEVVSRLLGAPGNWGLETATDLLLGICGEELKPASSPLLGRVPRNYDHSEWLRTRVSQPVAGPARPGQSSISLPNSVEQILQKEQSVHVT